MVNFFTKPQRERSETPLVCCSCCSNITILVKLLPPLWCVWCISLKNLTTRNPEARIILIAIIFLIQTQHILCIFSPVPTSGSSWKPAASPLGEWKAKPCQPRSLMSLHVEWRCNACLFSTFQIGKENSLIISWIKLTYRYSLICKFYMEEAPFPKPVWEQDDFPLEKWLHGTWEHKTWSLCRL